MEKSPEMIVSEAETKVERGASVRPVLIVITVIALVAGPLLVLEQIWPEQPWRLLLLFLLLVTIQSVLSSLWQNRPQILASSLKIRAAEFVVILVLLRIFTWIFTGGFPGLSDAAEYLRRPESLFDGFFLIASVMSLFVVLWSESLTRIFSELSLEQFELPKPKNSRGSILLADDPTRMFTDRQSIIKRYYRDWAAGGAILITCAAISTFDFVEYIAPDSWVRSIRNIARLGMRPEMLVALLAYFLGGFLLASEGRLAMLKARWTYDGVTIEKQVINSWRKNSVILLVVIALVAALVPIGATFNISVVFQAVGWIAIFILGLIVSLFAAIYYVIYTLLLSPMQPEEGPPLTFEEVVPEVPQIVPQPEGIFALILGTLIWIIIVAVIVIAAIYLIRNRGIHLRRGDFGKWRRRLWHWLQSQWRRLSSQVQTIRSERLSNLPNVARPSVQSPAPWRFIRLRSLSPRERIRYFYLSAVRRAAARGISRESGETPSEYVNDLSGEWPVVSEEIEDLTEAFEKARYSKDSIHESEVDSVKPIWKRVRAALRR